MFVQGLIIVHLIVHLTALTLGDGVKTTSRGRGVIYILLKCSKHMCILSSILSSGHECAEKEYIYIYMYVCACVRVYIYLCIYVFGITSISNTVQTPFVPKHLLFKGGHDEVARRHTSSAPQTLSGVPQM